MSKTYAVYIMSNVSRMLYVGVTRNLETRVLQHKRKLVPGFTNRYNLFMLVYFEEFADVRDAIRREKQIKSWRRTRKVALIKATNPDWKDLAAGRFRPSRPILPS